MANGYTHPWTDDRLQQAIQMWADGLSAAVIGAALGMTRSAVLGKINRLGLHRARTARATPWVDQGVSERTWQRRKSKPHARPPQARLEPVLDQTPDLPPDQSEHPLTIMELKDEHCRYPISGEGMATMFCADEAIVGSYCARHHRITHQPTRERTDPYWIDTSRVKNRGRRAA